VFIEAVKGVTKEVEIDGKKRKIKVPAGADDGTRIRFNEFDISLNVRPDMRYQREGYDVYLDEEIPLGLAVLGGTCKVKTLDGELNLRIRPGTQSHTLVRLRGEGIRYLQGGGRGDLYVRIKIKIPEKLTKEQKELFEKLKELGN
jgi:DnaJ-class molecular chaperone